MNRERPLHEIISDL